MATIYWDDSARTAGATMVASVGDTMVLRTDTRWHANAPASMTGVLGGLQINTNSKILIDGTKVRWMAYDSGSGNVPAIGTTVTQGGVSGYLLGVWANYTSAPTAVGAAMPTAGWIKFREVTGGQFAPGALSGIGANATEADRVGWIEAVIQQYGGFFVSSPCALETDGDWFELGTTSGTAGQTIQLPTNAGGSGTLIHGLQIETSVGSGVYEWWPVLADTYFTTTNIGTTSRSKILRNASNGAVMIGATSGAANAGFTPEAGLKIRSPNIFLRLCTSAARATNLAPTQSAYSFGASTASYIPNIILRNVQNDWSMAYYADTFTYEDSATFSGSIVMQRIYGEAVINNMNITPSTLSGSFSFGGSTKQLTISNTKFATYSSGPSFSNSQNIDISNVKFLDYTPAGSAATLSFQTCSNVTMNTIQTMGMGLSLSAGGNNFVIDGHDVIASNRGDTTSTYTGPSTAVLFGTSNVKYKNMTIGNYGEFPNTVPYNTLFRFSSCSNVTVTDIASISNPMYPYSTVAAPDAIFAFQSVAKNIKVKRAFFGHAKNYFISGNLGAFSDIVFENVGIPNASSSMTAVQPTFTDNSYIKAYASGIASPTNSPSMGASQSTRCTTDSIGTTGGFITTKFLSGYSQLTQTAGSYLSLSQVNFTANSSATDYCIIEQDYFIRGHSSLSNFSVTSNGAASINVTYQIDTGTGWNGTWKTLNTTNLTSEVIDPAIGFKVKFKCFNTHVTNAYYVSAITLTTTVPSRANQPTYYYPLSTANLSFTGLVPGSEVRVYKGTDPATALEIGGIESTAGSTFSLSQSYAGESGVIVIFAMGYQPIYLNYTFSDTDENILIQQVVDRNYTNPA